MSDDAVRTTLEIVGAALAIAGAAMLGGIAAAVLVAGLLILALGAAW